MTEKRYFSRTYNGYPVIVDNKDDAELTLDSVVKLLNTKEFNDRMTTEELNHLHRNISYMREQRETIESKTHRLKQIIVVMAFVILLETLCILGV